MDRFYPAVAAFVLATNAGSFTTDAAFASLSDTHLSGTVAPHDPPVPEYRLPPNDRRHEATSNKTAPSAPAGGTNPQ